MRIHSDFLVLGSGVAGLMFALKVAEHGQVAVVTKSEISESNTVRAQGGVASVFSDRDSFELHIKDTLESGAGLCDPEVTDMVVRNGPERIRELMDMGVQFSQTDGDHLDLGREGGHSEKRIVHALDMTGWEIESVLVARVKSHPRIRVYEHHIAIDFLTHARGIRRGLVVTSHEERCCGAYVLDIASDRVCTFTAAVTLLATGGAGKVYPYTSNPDVATGDGVAMAYRAGASVANLEFVQFHPTCLYHPEAKNFLISEAVRGEGGILRNARGEAFMERYSPLKDLACRDVVARAIDTELKRTGDSSAFLDISHRDEDFVRRRFPNLYARCMNFGIDMTNDPIPVVPAAHYMCGGVATDLSGRTDISCLYAVGETACTGLHGANRLASNSLLEALVYAHRAAENAIAGYGGQPLPEDLPDWDEMGTTDSDEAVMVAHNWDEIRMFMWNYVGIVRSDKRLARARRRIDNIQREIQEYYWNFRVTSDLIELRNIALVAELIIRSAQRRKESRGLHFSIDFPDRDDKKWGQNTVLKRSSRT
ncbi:L-aspartate oxidase [Desulfobotulus sp. H1]|uniref:L-aspartate oxidase n=1 Tax=Desulfobotulus pelophilus TaxID=2823377 RepID=A0ABT3N9C3_9BACT|nr:L-aspartate oxidase [Desulfobotulus pelophilus]MCW7754035.1 L-aspartate oxidase [Desulfobotulus pelophilus]